VEGQCHSEPNIRELIAGQGVCRLGIAVVDVVMQKHNLDGD